MANSKRVLSLMAHPDNVEFLCVGELSLLRLKGCEARIDADSCIDRVNSLEPFIILACV